MSLAGPRCAGAARSTLFSGATAIAVFFGLWAMAGNAAAQEARSETMTVNGALRNFHALDGRTVSVRGWMSSCAPENCGLFANARDARRAVLTGFSLILRPDPNFLSRVRGQRIREVVVQARVVVTCRNGSDDDGNVTICVEHAGYLAPVASPRIIRP